MTNVNMTCSNCGRRHERQDVIPGGSWSCPSCRTTLRVAIRKETADVPAGTPWVAAVVAWLDTLETQGRRMIMGIGHFVTWKLWAWAGRQLLLLGQVAVKAGRVAAVFAFWAALTFAPPVLLRRTELGLLLALAWTTLALAGSVWGALYVRRRAPLPLAYSPGPSGSGGVV
jgi:hypothetical protein